MIKMYTLIILLMLIVNRLINMVVITITINITLNMFMIWLMGSLSCLCYDDLDSQTCLWHDEWSCKYGYDIHNQTLNIHMAYIPESPKVVF